MRNLLFIIILCCLGVIAGCGNDDSNVVKIKPILPEDVAKLEVDSVSPYNNEPGEMPDPNTKLYTRKLGRLDELFNDSNYVHWAEAERIGIEPLTDTRSHLNTRRPLVKVTSNPDFYVEPLNYSRPYLIPEASAMLHEIGRRFSDSLAARSGARYRIKVTSVLRTPEGVRRLRRVNRNAVDSSVHQLATTMDISYARFVPDDSRITHSADELKALLAEILWDMRAEGKCWVKYEIKQPCFHITVRCPQIPLEQ
ncbi:MAG: DUF5715 family protein [Firmicutes bacterium]|nr:DUF5715 family protein [Bacillota bacterium]MCM1400689.1 DUF5715 family protein [Bacteroides sp.]MCM1476383.1 DUF5715 family protein [Bacteroides sp.]